MTTDESILEEMIERATSPSKEVVDELGVQMFCMVVRSNSQLISKAQEMLVAKIRSNNVTESTRAIALLEECMAKCGADFQDEVAKFRFLNDLIRLVSEKYQGAKTPPPIKKRIMECLLLWTAAFPKKTKIRDAYDMLCKEGGVEHGNSQAVVPKRESILGMDEEVVAALIKSGNQENFKRANLLIQYRVSQEARRTELRLQQKNELEEVQTTVGVLNQMLDTFESDGGEKVDGSETMNLIRELYLACKKHKPNMQRMTELIENSDEELIDETLQVNDALHTVMTRFKNLIVHPPSKVQTENSPVKPSEATKTAKTNADLLSDLLGDAVAKPVTNSSVPNGVQTPVADLPANTAPASIVDKNTPNALDELSEVFRDAVSLVPSEGPGNTTKYFCSLDLLEPVNLFKPETDNKDNKEITGEKTSFRELREIDQLSEELFKQNLISNDRVRSFKKEPQKFTLNDLVKEKVNVKPIASPCKTTPTTSEASMKTSETVPDDVSPTREKDEKVMDLPIAGRRDIDDLMLLGKDEAAGAVNNADNSDKKSSQPMELPFKHLSEISIELDDVSPTAEERLLMNDDDVRITLNFTENRPSRHVTVIVISVYNKSKLPVKDFQFEASVKKPCKVRLLPPTDYAMPACKSFRQPTPINQVMLLLNPTGKAVDVTCIVGYKLGDDPDPIKESIVAKDIPYAE